MSDEPTITAVNADPPRQATRLDDQTPRVDLQTINYVVETLPSSPATVIVDTAIVFGYPPLQVVTYTTSTTLTANDDIAIFNSASALTCNLPGASVTRLWFTVVNAGTNTVTVDPAGAETIQGVASFVVLPGETIDVYSDAPGSWRIK